MPIPTSTQYNRISLWNVGMGIAIARTPKILPFWMISSVSGFLCLHPCHLSFAGIITSKCKNSRNLRGEHLSANAPIVAFDIIPCGTSTSYSYTVHYNTVWCIIIIMSSGAIYSMLWRVAMVLWLQLLPSPEDNGTFAWITEFEIMALSFKTRITPCMCIWLSPSYYTARSFPNLYLLSPPLSHAPHACL